MLAKTLGNTGLTSLEIGHVDQPTIFRDFDDYWTLERWEDLLANVGA